MPTSNKPYLFTLILSGVRELTDDVCDALFEAGCDDALPGMRDGVAFLDFTRQGSSYQGAVLSAIAAVEGAGIGARVVRVEPDELVTMSEIARRARRSRENIRQLVIGLRGPGDFPPPLANLTKKSAIWRWTDVAQWFKEKEASRDVTPTRKMAPSDPTAVEMSELAAINATLEVRRHVTTSREARNLYDALFAGVRSRP